MLEKVLEIVRKGEKTPMQHTPAPKANVCEKVNRMIIEYLDWFGYHYTLEMFQSETGAKISSERFPLKKGEYGTPDEELPKLLQLSMRIKHSK